MSVDLERATRRWRMFGVAAAVALVVTACPPPASPPAPTTTSTSTTTTTTTIPASSLPHATNIGCKRTVWGASVDFVRLDVEFDVVAPEVYTPGSSVSVSVSVEPGIPIGYTALGPERIYQPYMDFETVGGVAASTRLTSPTRGPAEANTVLAVEPLVGSVETDPDGAVVTMVADRLMSSNDNFVLRCTLDAPLVIGMDATTVPTSTTTSTTSTSTTSTSTTTTTIPEPTFTHTTYTDCRQYDADGVQRSRFDVTGTYQVTVPAAFVPGDLIELYLRMGPGVPIGSIAPSAVVDVQPYMDFDTVGGTDPVTRVQLATPRNGSYLGFFDPNPMVGTVQSTAATTQVTLTADLLFAAVGDWEIRCPLEEPLVIQIDAAS